MQIVPLQLVFSGDILTGAKLEVHLMRLSYAVLAGAIRAVGGYSSIGRALAWHARGQGFNSP